MDDAEPVETGGAGLLLRGVLASAGLGLVAGGLEAAVSAVTSPAVLTAGERVVLGVAAAAADALGAAVVALLLGLVLVLPRGWTESPVRVARQMAGTALVLAGLPAGEAAAVLVAEERVAGALVLATVPLLAAAIVYFNARLWLRRAERDEATAPWLPVAAVATAAGIAASVAIGAAAPTPRPAGPSVVLVTVDGLGPTAVGPRLEALAAQGVVFADAVTPSPVPRAALAAVLAGVHPLRVAVLDPDDRLARGWRTAPEALADAGVATAAFLSTEDAASGLLQGFAAVDDGLPAWRRPHLVRRVLRPGARRDGDATAAAFERWLAGHADAPFAAWVQLPGPDDAPIGRVHDALVRAGALGRTTVVVAGTRGLPGTTLSDATVRVALVVHPPQAPEVPRVDAQVRLTDVANTLLEAAGLPALDESEGVPLLGYGSGLRGAAMWTSLVGVDAEGRRLLGLRNNGVKYVVHADGREELYELRTDPGETRDRSADQPETLEQARTLLLPEQRALERADR